jgi:hypothetical protein
MAKGEPMNMMTVIRTIHEKHKTEMKGGKPSKPINDTIPCPVCRTGKIAYSISSRNGHIHAKCDTAGCVFFMQ